MPPKKETTKRYPSRSKSSVFKETSIDTKIKLNAKSIVKKKIAKVSPKPKSSKKEKKTSETLIKDEKDNWNTEVEFKADYTTECKDENKNNYIVSFGFEYERGKFYVFRKDKNTWKNFILTDGRFKQKIIDKENELLEITADSSKGLFNRDVYGDPNNYSFVPPLKDYDGNEITFDDERLSREGNRYDFDYLECIYTIKKLTDKESINFNCLVKYDNEIRKIIQKYFKENYVEENKIYNMKLEYFNGGHKRTYYKKPIQYISDDDDNLGIKIYKPKNKKANLPWMMCPCPLDEKDYCPSLDSTEWSAQATVGINYSNIINFMRHIFSEYKFEGFEKEALEKASKIANNFIGDTNNMKNWFILKLFYLYIDIKHNETFYYFIKEKEPLDIANPKLKDDNIENEYKMNWIALSEKKRIEHVFNNKYDTRRYISNKFAVNKSTTDFQIRHSLYQILYELYSKNTVMCLKFLGDMITNITNLSNNISDYEKTYYIQDLKKGIYYFQKLQNENPIENEFKKFQEFNDPDLCIEENYGKIETYTKYRIKYYKFSTENNFDEGKLNLTANTLLFEMRSYRSIRKEMLGNL